MKVAVITGASSGMGQQFCLQLDGKYDEIWGLALDEEGLKETEGLLKKSKFKMIAGDLTDEKIIKIYEDLLKKENPDVAFLANCSGFCKFGSFEEIPLAVSVSMINLNVTALVKMSEITIPFMHEGARIVNIASMAGLQPTPYMNVYGASKAFVLSYSRSLNRELKSKKITCTCMCPLWTNTKFLSVANQTGSKKVSHISSSYSASDVVKRGIDDAMKGKDISIYGTKSFWQRLFVKITPQWMIMSIWENQQKRGNK